MLVVDITYKKPLEEILKALQAHRDFLATCYDAGKFLASGPKDPRTGGVIIALVGVDEMERLILQDPFHIEGLADYTITEFDPILRCKQLEPLLG